MKGTRTIKGGKTIAGITYVYKAADTADALNDVNRGLDAAMDAGRAADAAGTARKALVELDGLHDGAKALDALDNVHDSAGAFGLLDDVYDDVRVLDTMDDMQDTARTLDRAADGADAPRATQYSYRGGEVSPDLRVEARILDESGDVAETVGRGGRTQVIQNRYRGEPQAGWEISYTVENGKIYVDNGMQNVDFIIDMDGDLHIGSGHSYLANGADVQAAGTLKINSQGYIRSITNASGHYAPTVEQGRIFPNILNVLGIRTQNAWLELGDYHFTPSGYVDLTHSSTIVEQLK